MSTTLTQVFAAIEGLDYTEALEELVSRAYNDRPQELVEVLRTYAQNKRAEQAAREERERYNYVGALYESGRDIKDTAVLIRRRIKKEFPRIKASVRIERYSGGTGLWVKITRVPFEVRQWMADDRCIYTEEANRLKSAIHELIKEYNFDKSDSSTDYFHVGFYPHVDYSFELQRQEPPKPDSWASRMKEGF